MHKRCINVNGVDKNDVVFRCLHFHFDFLVYQQQRLFDFDFERKCERKTIRYLCKLGTTKKSESE